MDSRLSILEAARESERSAPGSSFWISLLVVVIVLPALVFFVARLLLPGDGNVAVFDFDDEGGEGLLVQPLASAPAGVQAGDRLMAMDDRSLELWLGNLWGGEPLESSAGATSLPEVVQRDSQSIALAVALKPFPLLAALAQRWSMFLFAAYLLGMSIFVFALRPHELGARLFVLLGALVFGNICIFSLGLQISELRRPWLILLWLWHCLVTGQLVLPLALHMALLFPRRQPLLDRVPGLLIWVYLGVGLLYGTFVCLRWPEAATIAERLVLLIQGTVVTAVVYFPLVLAAWVTGYVSCKNSVQRRQIAWILWGMVVGLAGFMGLALVPALLGPRIPLGTNFALVGILLFAIPTTATIAILRERLFDINFIVNRTLVYVPLTSILAGVYAASMSILPKIFAGNGAASSPTSIVLTTLILTVAFNPVKNWLQALVDRGFKEAPDPLKPLHEFDREVLGIVRIIDVNQIGRRFLEESMTTLQAQGGVIQMVRNQQWTTIHRSDHWSGEANIVIPITCNHVHLGTLMLGARTNGRAYNDAECGVLRQTADHVGVVIAILQSAGAIPPDQFCLSGYQLLDMPKNGRVTIE